MPWLLPMLVLGLSGCDAGEERPVYVRPDPPTFGDSPTGTVPDFHGRVPSNVLVLSIDTLRPDHLSWFSPGGPAETPVLDLHMDQGFVATDHHACSNWTFHAMSCTTLGRDPVQIGVMPRLEPAHQAQWPPGTDSLAGWFRDAGFYTVLSTSNGWMGAAGGSDQGYDAVYGEGFADAWPTWADARDDLTGAIAAGRADRWLMHLHLMEPHAPYDAPVSYYYPEALMIDPVPVDLDLNHKPQHYEATLQLWPELSEEDQALLEEHLRLRYAGQVEWLDDKLRRILVDMHWYGLLDDTLVVVVSDHGEQFWERGHQSHAYNLNREETEALWFFWAPNIVPGTWDAPTSQVDLAPTLLQLYGLPVPPGLEGLPLGEAPDDRALHLLTVARLGGAQAVIRDGWKMTWSWGGFARLYDLVADPLEQTDLYDPSHERVSELWPLLVERMPAAAALAPDQAVRPPSGLVLEAP